MLVPKLPKVSGPEHPLLDRGWFIVYDEVKPQVRQNNTVKKEKKDIQHEKERSGS